MSTPAETIHRATLRWLPTAAQRREQFAVARALPRDKRERVQGQVAAAAVAAHRALVTTATEALARARGLEAEARPGERLRRALLRDPAAAQRAAALRELFAEMGEPELLESARESAAGQERSAADFAALFALNAVIAKRHDLSDVTRRALEQEIRHAASPDHESEQAALFLTQLLAARVQQLGPWALEHTGLLKNPSAYLSALRAACVVPDGFDRERRFTANDAEALLANLPLAGVNPDPPSHFDVDAALRAAVRHDLEQLPPLDYTTESDLTRMLRALGRQASEAAAADAELFGAAG